MAGIGDRERFCRIRGIQRDVAQRMQLRQHIVAHQFVVFDNQDGFVTALDDGRRRRLGGRQGSGGRRQIHLDCRAVALLAVDHDVPG